VERPKRSRRRGEEGDRQQDGQANRGQERERRGKRECRRGRRIEGGGLSRKCSFRCLLYIPLPLPSRFSSVQTWFVITHFGGKGIQKPFICASTLSVCVPSTLLRLFLAAPPSLSSVFLTASVEERWDFCGLERKKNVHACVHLVSTCRSACTVTGNYKGKA